MKLTEKQKRFADYYIETGNATESYHRAYGGKRTTADANGTKLLGNTRVKEYIKERNKQLESDRIADMEEVKKFWTNTMRDDEADVRDRLKASEYIAKTNAAFIEKQEVKSETEGKLDINIKVIE